MKIIRNTLFVFLIMGIILSIAVYTESFILCCIGTLLFQYFLYLLTNNFIYKESRLKFIKLLFTPTGTLIVSVMYWNILYEALGLECDNMLIVLIGSSTFLNMTLFIFFVHFMELKRIKIILGFHLAIVTTILAILFLLTPFLADVFAEYIFNKEFADYNEVVAFLDNVDNRSELAEDLSEYIPIEDSKGNILSSTEIINNIIEFNKEKFGYYIGLAIQVIVLPFLLIGTWGNFIIKIRETRSNKR